MLPEKIYHLFSAPPRVRFADSFGRHVSRTNPVRDLYPLSDKLFDSGMYLGYHSPFDVMYGRARVPAECMYVFGVCVDALHHVA